MEEADEAIQGIPKSCTQELPIGRNLLETEEKTGMSYYILAESLNHW
ncbi:hypothetical protein ACINLE_15680 [Bacillus sp. z60-18]